MSCHSILEFDELRILNELGHEVFCIGAYMNPQKTQVNNRTPLQINPNYDLIQKYHFYVNKNIQDKLGRDDCYKTLNKDFVDYFDCIIVMHITNWIDLNLEIFKNKRVILRTIGQNVENNENILNEHKKNNIKILRYSPKERELNNYAGEDALIRFLKYKSDFKPRNFKTDKVITFGQSIPSRKNWCGSHIIEQVAEKTNFKLFGPNNDSFSFSGGFLSYEDQIEQLSSNAAYLYTGTFPAQYTLNFIEALFAGIPIVSIGRNLSQTFVDKYPFEVPDILDLIDGFYFDSVDEIVFQLKKISSNTQLMEDISKKQQILADKMFSVEENIYQWKDFLNSL